MNNHKGLRIIVTFTGDGSQGYGWTARTENGGFAGESLPLEPYSVRTLEGAFHDALDKFKGTAITTIDLNRYGFHEVEVDAPFEVSRIRGKVIRTNPHTGERTIAYPHRTLRAIADYWGVDKDDALKRIRGGRINAKGQLTFRCGGGYDVLSADLLDGSADGKALRDFEDATGLTLSY